MVTIQIFLSMTRMVSSQSLAPQLMKVLQSKSKNKGNILMGWLAVCPRTNFEYFYQLNFSCETFNACPKLCELQWIYSSWRAFALKGNQFWNGAVSRQRYYWRVSDHMWASRPSSWWASLILRFSLWKNKQNWLVGVNKPQPWGTFIT